MRVSLWESRSPAKFQHPVGRKHLRHAEMDKMISFTFPHGAFPKAAQPSAERDPPTPARDVSQGLRRTHGERVPSSLSGAGHCPRDTLLPHPSRNPEVLAGGGGERPRAQQPRLRSQQRAANLRVFKASVGRPVPTPLRTGVRKDAQRH